MRRLNPGGGALALAMAGALCLFFIGCAQAGLAATDGGVRDHGTGGGDQGQGTVDLLGADLTGGGGGDAAACDPLAQSGCGSGEKCTLSMASTACVADGDKTLGQLCGAAGADDCQKGNVCLSESMTSMVSQCRPFCAKDADCKQPAQAGITSNLPHCLISIKGTMPAVTVCTVACQPVTAAGASGCATGLACQVFATATLPQATDCSVAGAGGDAADCTTNGDGDCQAGFTCVSETPSGGGAAQNHCRKVCRSGKSGDCTGLGGYTCQTPTGTGPFPWGFCEP